MVVIVGISMNSCNIMPINIPAPPKLVVYKIQSKFLDKSKYYTKDCNDQTPMQFMLIFTDDINKYQIGDTITLIKK